MTVSSEALARDRIHKAFGRNVAPLRAVKEEAG
jgi:hypothetical protein